MRRHRNIADIFPKHVFWDMDYSRLDLQQDKDIIIPRALYATTELTFQEDIRQLEDLYSKSQILKHLKNTKERISNKVCLMVADRFHTKEFARFKH
ncbi:hypothetical protein GCM10007103_14560 [Salinimicrobium marinum]|uniref:DUF6922 domain-containing protein n=1 Tax=Salinimicrobium marinum TaxID=680283 RepID=A0A918SE12_9FLAO|nr:hypothetical protein [Salinimicrobium marinum]GHA34072.1 hypothetical protein GCM10007103_14560 [Salinimicrobium marinum]